jgi:hypothetical protein
VRERDKHCERYIIKELQQHRSEGELENPKPLDSNKAFLIKLMSK